MSTIRLRLWVGAVAALGLLAACQPVMPVQEAREITVWAGGGQDTAVIEAFLPERIDVRAGDTVTWKLGGEEIHSVTLLSGAALPLFALPVPGGGPLDVMVDPMWGNPSRQPGAAVEVYDGANFLTSGLMSTHLVGENTPPINEFSATFSTPGTFQVHCVVHPWMTAEVVVHPNSDPNVPSQAEIDAQIEAEEARHLADIEVARELGNAAIQNEALGDGSTLWHVRVGGFNPNTANENAASYDMMPKQITIQAGDTVMWESAAFHAIVFDPVAPPVESEIVQEMEGDWPRILLNPEILVPSKPSPIYDPTQFYTSSDIGPYGLNGSTWSLTFEEPGTYDYFCPFHRYLGMEGTVVVE